MMITATATRPERWFHVRSSPREDDLETLVHSISVAHLENVDDLPYPPGYTKPDLSVAYDHLATLTSPKCTPTQAERLARAWLSTTQAEDLDVECTWHAWPLGPRSDGQGQGGPTPPRRPWWRRRG